MQKNHLNTSIYGCKYYGIPPSLAIKELTMHCSRFLPLPPSNLGPYFLFIIQATFFALRQIISHLLGLKQRPNPPPTRSTLYVPE